MFGPKMRFIDETGGVDLLPPTKKQIMALAPYLQSMEVTMYTGFASAPTAEDEEEWFEKVRKDRFAAHWAIFPHEDGKPVDMPVGITGLHNRGFNGSCSSGIIIGDPSWWGRGIASRCHLLRTLYAHDEWETNIIHSQVRVPNTASRKALERVGYVVTGISPCTAFRRGAHLHTYSLTWHTPDLARFHVLYPDGYPECFTEALQHNIEEGRKKAAQALQRAREGVIYRLD